MGHVEVGRYILIDAGIYSVVIANVAIRSPRDVGVAAGIDRDGRAISERRYGICRTDHGGVNQGRIASGGGSYLGSERVFKSGADVLLRETPPDRTTGNGETARSVDVALHVIDSGNVGVARAVDSNR